MRHFCGRRLRGVVAAIVALGLLGAVAPRAQGVGGASFVVSPSTQVRPGAVLEFDGAASSGMPVLWEWQFGDSTTETNPWARASHVFQTAGKYSVALRVLDLFGGWSEPVSQQVAVSEAPQVVISEVAERADVDRPLHVDATGSTDPDGSISSFRWKVECRKNPPAGERYPDGVKVVWFTSTSPIAEIPLRADWIDWPDGPYPGGAGALVDVWVQATDDAGVKTEWLPARMGVRFLPGAQLRLSATPLQGSAPLTVGFDASGSFAQTGVASYVWDFDDAEPPAKAIDVVDGVPTVSHAFDKPGVYEASLRVRDGAGYVYGATKRVSVSVDGLGKPVDGQPPVPATGGPISLAESSDHIYKPGSAQVQFDLETTRMDWSRRAVIVGQVVRASDGKALDGAKVTVRGHPEFGYSLSRADGSWDMVVNGGAQYVVQVSRPGMLPLQRGVATAPQEWAYSEAVALKAQAPKAGTAVLGLLAPDSFLKGEQVTDAEGSRQLGVYVPVSTAGLARSGSDVSVLSEASPRLTEYTVGPLGQQSMPGELPLQSAYTYAFDAAFEEAAAANAEEVGFSKPLVGYLDVSGFSVGASVPVGTVVPIGGYSIRRASWAPEDNGRVIQVLDEAGAKVIDATGDGVGDNVLDPALALRPPMSGLEAARVVANYAVGARLWRFGLNDPAAYERLASDQEQQAPSGGGGGDADAAPQDPVVESSLASLGKDLNYRVGLPSGADYPAVVPDVMGGMDGASCKWPGSVIECENQVLGESVPVLGAGFDLAYRSDRVPGRTVERQVQIELGPGATGPRAAATSTVVDVRVAGRQFQVEVPAAQSNYVFTWDGKDHFGRVVNGAAEVQYRIGYRYPIRYLLSSPQAVAGNDRLFASTANSDGSAPRPGQTTVLWSAWAEGRIGGWAANPAELGGWTASVNHVFDPVGRVVYYGSGRRRQIGDATPARLSRVTDGIWANQVAVGPDGSVYTGRGDSHGGAISARRPNGSVETIVPTWTASKGDGGTARNAGMRVADSGNGLAVGPDGSLYVAEAGANRVRRIAPDPADRDGRVTPNSIVSTVAGPAATSTSDASACPDPAATCGDGGAATAGRLHSPGDVAVGVDGTIYVADTLDKRVRQVATDGRISTLVGPNAASGDNRSGDLGQLAPDSVAVDKAGRVYFADETSGRVWRVPAGGVAVRVAGLDPGQTPCAAATDGCAATQARVAPATIRVGPDDSLYIGEVATGSGQVMLRRVGPDGTIRRVAGNNAACRLDTDPHCGPEGPAASAAVEVSGVAFDPRGDTIYLGLRTDGLWRVDGSGANLAIADSASGGYRIPAEDGTLLYHFNRHGRHTKTTSLLTGVDLLEFRYANGVLVGIDDPNNTNRNVTVSQAGLNAIHVDGPHGRKTVLGVDGGTGYLTSMRDPAGHTTTFVHGRSNSLGLLTSLTTPLPSRPPATHTFTYSPDGRLEKDIAPGGTYTRLARTIDRPTQREVVVKTDVEDGQNLPGLTLTTTLDSTGAVTKDLVDGNGYSRRSIASPDGSVSGVDADGTTRSARYGPDPRWGLLLPVVQESRVQLPLAPNETARRVLVARETRTLTRHNGDADTLSTRETIAMTNAAGQTRMATIDWAYDPITGGGTLTSTSPGSVTTTATLDMQARVRRSTRPRLAGVEQYDSTYDYDGEGRINKTVAGGRSLTYRYYQPGDTIGNRPVPPTLLGTIRSVTDQDGDSRGVALSDDLLTATTTDPAGNETRSSHDTDSNVTRIRMPNSGSVGQPQAVEHEYRYNSPDGTLAAYSLPPLAGDPQRPRTTTLGYNSYDQLDIISEPDGARVRLGYEGTRLARSTVDAPLTGDVVATAATTSDRAPNGLTQGQYRRGTGGVAVDRLHGSEATSTTYGDWMGDRPLRADLAGYTTNSVALHLDQWAQVDRVTLLGTDVPISMDPATGRVTGMGDIKVTKANGESGYDTASGAITHVTAGGVTTQYSYNAYGEIDREATTAGGSRVVAEVSARNPKGSIATERVEVTGHPDLERSYTYDKAGRLHTATSSSTSERYCYDPDGNRVAVLQGSQPCPSDASAFRYAYNERDQLALDRTTSTPTTYNYDDVGNRLNTRRGHALTWDRLYGRKDLAAAVRVGAPPVNYHYTPTGELDGRTAAGTTTKYVYAGGDRPVAQADSTGRVLARYYYGTTSTTPDLIVTPDGGRHRVLTDKRGSVVAVVDTATNQIEQSATYSPWGEVLTRSSHLPWQPFGFAGGLEDPETGLTRLGHRWYDPSTASWVSPDPSGQAGGVNRYQYAASDPVNLVDPTGHEPKPEDAIRAALIAKMASEIYSMGSAGGAAGSVALPALAGAVLTGVVSAGLTWLSATMGVSFPSDLEQQQTMRSVGAFFRLVGANDLADAIDPIAKPGNAGGQGGASSPATPCERPYDYKYSEGPHFIAAHVSDGFLSITIEARGNGDRFYDAMMDYFRMCRTAIYGIWGHWGTRLPSNLNAFNRALLADPTLDLDAAALDKTWSGTKAKQYGYTTVDFRELSPMYSRGYYTWVELIFR